ncbi:uncharacterized LOC118071249 [Chelonus insularis]|uniref:uncharacterized LOC118071249 n=1 Tax=Chelonus insularis TaxID=460826 RepID=UPI00158DA5AE|nr:uncharacterized LOC118071249 [Chelonus insularis]KAG8148330.1 K425_459-like protein [Chelonus insularis]
MSIFIDSTSTQLKYIELTNLRGINMIDDMKYCTIQNSGYAHYIYSSPLNAHTQELLKHGHVDRKVCVYINRSNNDVLFIRFDSLAESFYESRCIVYELWHIKECTRTPDDKFCVQYYIDSIDHSEWTMMDESKLSIDDFEYAGHGHWRYFDKGILYYGVRYTMKVSIQNAMQYAETITNYSKHDESIFLESFIMYAVTYSQPVLWSQCQLHDFIKRFNIKRINNISFVTTSDSKTKSSTNNPDDRKLTQSDNK